MTAEVYVAEPYSAVGRDVDNSYDSIFEDSLVLTVTAADAATARRTALQAAALLGLPAF